MKGIRSQTKTQQIGYKCAFLTVHARVKVVKPEPRLLNLPDAVVAIRGARIAIRSHDQAQKLYD
jgi:hypothetical protein